MAEEAFPEARPEEAARQAAWLSHGLERLVHDHTDVDPEDVDFGDSEKSPAEAARDPHFDVVIVGSGYGGAVAAYELARIAEGSRPKVCILERGSEYLRGAFPSRMADLAGHIRFAGPDNNVARGTLEGLFDVRVGPDVSALVANGLGGGSLINAGVLEMPHPSVFRESRWPEAIRSDATLCRRARSLRRLLGAARVGANTEKLRALQSLEPKRFRPVRASVASAKGLNRANTELDECIKCGDCATGCNHNAKDSLDLNLLRIAREANTSIYTGASVIGIERGLGGRGWVVVVNHTERHLRERQKQPFRVRTATVILAAGTFGSTEILMRSGTSTLRFSPQLGRKFSSNGDTIFLLNNTAHPVNGVAREDDPPAQRAVGPTITGMIDRRTGDPQTDVVIQDLGVPGPLRALFQEAAATTDAFNQLLIRDHARHQPDDGLPDSAAIDEAQTERALAVAMIGRDSADGVLERRHDKFVVAGDGVLTVRWPSLRNDARFAAYHKQLSDLLQSSPLHRDGARVLQNPVWRPLSGELEAVFGPQRGPMMTVHPLGGCPMGTDSNEGVVDHFGRVFNPDARCSESPFHPGLLVLDGSIVPTSLGINPSLTIAVLVQRAMEEWTKGRVTTMQPDVLPEPKPRPRFATIVPQPPRPTKIQVTEQLCGRIHLTDDDPARREGDDLALTDGHEVELTLTYAPQQVANLRSRDGTARRLQIADGRGMLRIFRREPATNAQGWERGKAEIEVAVSGTLTILRHGASRPGWRALRALVAWFFNRGFRDSMQNLYDKLRRWLGVLPRLDEAEQTPCQYLAKLIKLADHAGSVRLFEYGLTTGSKVGGKLGDTMPWFANAAIKGRKQLRYAVGANPWTQLQELTLTKFPHLERPWNLATPRGLRVLLSGFARARARFFQDRKLTLNLDYLVMRSVPLLRVVAQQDRPTALVELTRFALYLFRVVLQVHALSFRRPDARTDREPNRLPGEILGRLPVPEIEWRPVARKPNGAPVLIRLARYRDPIRIAGNGTAAANPVLLIHGYSASGTTYAHRAVKANVAETLCNAGRDVWIVELRSSAGLDSATEPWAFEDMAEVDIPEAIEHILAVAGGTSGKIDVVAHCMGSAMFSMAVLGGYSNALSQKIGRVVLSQVGPVMKLSTANVFRAYLMRWIRYFLPLDDYSFRPVKKKLSLGGNYLDRILATLPYPRSEFRLENPLWPPGVALPWATSRHRMDALYARTFSLANLSADVLDHIDDFFGPLSIETVSQVIHFAQTCTVTDRTGFNDYVNPRRLQSRITFPILYLHGRDNGLSDASTLDLMAEKMRNAGIPHLPGEHLGDARGVLAAICDRRAQLQSGGASLMTWCIDGHGHQDPMIGIHAHEVSHVIERFLGA